MSLFGIDIKENPFYCPYDNECWVLLAKEIMSVYSDKYSYQIPINALSQAEYDTLDRKTYAPIRRSILKNIKYGPIGNAVNITSAYSALESLRKEAKARMGVSWRDNYYEDISKI